MPRPVRRGLPEGPEGYDVGDGVMGGGGRNTLYVYEIPSIV